jgi:L-amino acid N-acyltransferase YncA
MKRSPPAALAIRCRLQFRNACHGLPEHPPQQCPIVVDVEKGELRGWCSLSPYRKGRLALRYTKEVSYFVAARFHRQGVGLALVQHAKGLAQALGTKTLFASFLNTILRASNFSGEQDSRAGVSFPT